MHIVYNNSILTFSALMLLSCKLYTIKFDDREDGEFVLRTQNCTTLDYVDDGSLDSKFILVWYYYDHSENGQN